MTIRALSGVVFTRGVRRGSATILFRPHRAEAPDPVTVGELATLGPDGAFSSAPCKHVAIRQFTLPGESGLPATRSLVVDDEVDAEHLVIRWDSEGPAFLSEISYLVVGEVADA